MAAEPLEEEPEERRGGIMTKEQRKARYEMRRLRLVKELTRLRSDRFGEPHCPDHTLQEFLHTAGSVGRRTAKHLY